MKKTMLILLAFKVLIFGKCLDETERYNLQRNFYGSVDCKSLKKTNFEEAICSNKDFVNMFAYYGQSFADFWFGQGLTLGANVEEMNANFQKKVKEDDKQWNDIYSEKKINLDNLCFDLKSNTTVYAHISSIYNMASISRDDGHYLYYVQENKYGAALTDREGGKVYLGKNCDVLDDKKQKGFWYGYKENINDDKYTYVIKLKDKDLKLNMTKIINLDEIECTEDKIKELMQK